MRKIEGRLWIGRSLLIDKHFAAITRHGISSRLADVGGCYCALRNVDIQGQGDDCAQGFERLLPCARLIESFEQMGATRLTVAAGKAAQRCKRHFVRRS
jgi:hypothetical protein